MDLKKISKQECLDVYNKIQKEKGEFLKEGRLFKLIQKRYFTICNDSLLYYKDRSASKVRGIVNLLNCNFELQWDKQRQQRLVKVKGFVHPFIIWLIAKSDQQALFFWQYLSAARQGTFRENLFDCLSAQAPNQPDNQINIQIVQQRTDEQVMEQKQHDQIQLAQMQEIQQVLQPYQINQTPMMTLNKSNDILKNQNQLLVQESSFDQPSFIKNQSLIQAESDINAINISCKHSNYVFPEDTSNLTTKRKPQPITSSNIILSPRNILNSPSIKKRSTNFEFELANKFQSNLFRAEDCNVETTDEVPNTNYMKQYEFSYFCLDKHPSAYLPAIYNSRSSSSVGPQKRITMSKFEQRRQKTCVNDCSKKLMSQWFQCLSQQKNLKYTRPFGGDDNQNQMDISEINGHRDDDVMDIDFDQQQLYPMRKSMQDFEIEDICNDEIIRGTQRQQFVIKKSYKSINFNQKKTCDILNFENYQDEDIDDAPPGLSKECPLLLRQKIEFKNQIVRNSQSQFRNNSKCLDNFKRVRTSRGASKDADGEFFYNETQLIGAPCVKDDNLCGSRHLAQLKEMFQQHQIITNIRGNVIKHQTLSLLDPSTEEKDDDSNGDSDGEDNDGENTSPDGNNLDPQKVIQDEEMGNKTQLRNFGKGEEVKPYVHLDNEIRVQASQFYLSEQSVLNFTDTDDGLSLVTEHNNIDEKMTQYQNSGVFRTNHFQNRHDPSNVMQESKDFILSRRNLFLSRAIQFVWNSSMAEANYIFQSLPDEPLFRVEISLYLLLITGQFRYLDSSMQEYQQIINLIEKKDKCFQDYSELDKKAILCEVHMAIGLLKVLQERKLSALSSINTSHNYLMQIQKTLESTKKLNNISSQCKNRYLLIDGLFQIGLSLMPSFFSKIFSILGISIDQKRGIKCLTECMEMQEIKSNYARIILFLYYLETSTNVIQAQSIIKSSLLQSSISPIFNWLASLYYWKIAQSCNAVKYIKLAIDQSVKNNHQPHFFYFELGWFYLSELQWENAVKLFENMIIQGFDLRKIDINKLQKQCNAQKMQIDLKTDIYFSSFMKRSEECPFKAKVKIIHKCCIAFIIGVCFISSTDNNPLKSKNNSFQENNINTDKNKIQNGIIPENKENNDTNNIGNDEMKILYPQNLNDNAIQIQQKKNLKVENERIFKLWCHLALQISEKLGDSRTSLDNEFRRVIKLFSMRRHTFLIKYELLYFVKELSKVSNANLDKSLELILEYQNIHLVKYKKQLAQDNLIEICSSYLLIVGICYIRDRFVDILELMRNPLNIYANMSSLDKKYFYLAHHTYYWLGMTFKKNTIYEKAIQYFELSNNFKSKLFNLSSRIDSNMAEIFRNINK